MALKRKVNRRSFLAQVAGGGALLGGSLALVGPAARAQITDRDPSDPVGRGRGGGTGLTDTDTGVGADPAGRGRGGGPRPGQTGFSDSDSGANADPAGRGRGTAFGGDGGQYEARVRACNQIQMEITNTRIGIGNADAYIRRLEVTANYIASDYAATPEDQRDFRLREYQRRAYDLTGSYYSADADYIIADLNRRLAEARQQRAQDEQLLAQYRNMLAQYNCVEQ